MTPSRADVLARPCLLAPPGRCRSGAATLAVFSRAIRPGSRTRTVRTDEPSSNAVSSRAAVRPNSTLSRDSADSHKA